MAMSAVLSAAAAVAVASAAPLQGLGVGLGPDGALRAGTGDFPVVMNPPRWSWDTLGSMAFLHAGDSQPYTADDLALVGRFPMVQFDKKQGLHLNPHLSQEDRFILAARQVRAARANASEAAAVRIVMYINGLVNFPASRLFNATRAQPGLLLVDNSTGELMHLAGNTVFDVRQEAMRALFVEDAMYAMASGAFDGVFIDRANWASNCAWQDQHPALCASLVPAQRQLFVELTAALGDANLTIAKETSGTPMEDWHVANAAMTSDTFCSAYCHECNDSVTPASRWTPADAEDCASSIAAIANMSARGQLSQSHAMGPFPEGPLCDEARAFTMAAFLVAAGNLSYFSYGDWAGACWTLAGTRWWPEYDLALGEATTPPNTRAPGSQWRFVRNFSSGTTVSVDLLTREVDLRWAAAASSSLPSAAPRAYP